MYVTTLNTILNGNGSKLHEARFARVTFLHESEKCIEKKIKIVIVKKNN